MTTNAAMDAKAYQQFKTIWDRNWSMADFTPSWISTAIPQEVATAAEAQWFAPSATLLDIGCGSGKIAAWLAAQGFTVLGVDFSEGAIARAQAEFGQSAKSLTFQVADMCSDAPDEPGFQCLLDCGCLHGLPKAAHADYAQTVAKWALPGARFLLLCGYNQQARRPADEEYEMQKAMETHLAALFDPYFVIHQMTPTFRERSLPHEPVPALAVWMERR
jgi:2-heptyl-1-hydroxyquinolin-4(1H)-one methyltransferase